MDDKTIIIIFTAINALMWISVSEWMRKTNKNYMDFINAIEKDIRSAADQISADEKDIAKVITKSDALIKKGTEYYHDTFQQLTDITQMNVSAMSKFIEQISAIISTKDSSDEKENRK